MSVSPAPITQPVLDATGVPTLPWTLFFNQNFSGDAGTNWTPTFTNLSGVAQITGRFYRLSQYLIYFTITVTPDSATSATAGSTYVGDLPFGINSDGFCASVSGAAGGSLGAVDADTGRIYVPSWSSVSSPVTILGICEAR